MNYAAVNLRFRGFEQRPRGRTGRRSRSGPTTTTRTSGWRSRCAAPSTTRTSTRTSRRRARSWSRPSRSRPTRPETYYNEAILTQEYKAKSGGAGGEAELLNAKKLFGDFIDKAGGAAEFADAVKRSKDRMAEIDQIIEFNKQSEKDRKAAEADAKQKAAEAEAKGDEGASRRRRQEGREEAVVRHGAAASPSRLRRARGSCSCGRGAVVDVGSFSPALSGRFAVGGERAEV